MLRVLEEESIRSMSVVGSICRWFIALTIILVSSKMFFSIAIEELKNGLHFELDRKKHTWTHSMVYIAFLFIVLEYHMLRKKWSGSS